MHPYGNWEGHWLGGGFFMIFFYVFLVVLVIYLIRNMLGKGNQKDTALDILKKRYAAGEINKEQFEEMKNDLLL
jgi:putative membrane protein